MDIIFGLNIFISKNVYKYNIYKKYNNRIRTKA